MKSLENLMLGILLACVACTSFKPNVQEKKPQIVIKKDIPIVAKKDTILQTKKTEDVVVNTKLPSKDSVSRKSTKNAIIYRTSEKKLTYNIFYILPFNSHDVGPTQFDINRNSVWAVDFYTGAQMALLNFKDGPVSFNIYALDSKTSDQDFTGMLTRDEFKNADVIIGPYKNSHSKILSDFALANKITLVSPYNSASKATKSNPNYIQLVPSLSVHYDKLAEGVAVNHAKKLFVLTNGSPNEKNRVISLSNSLKAAKSDVNITEILLSDSQLKDNNARLDSLITLEDGMQFFIPSIDENTVIDLLRKIDQSKKSFQIKTFGMPQWQNFNRAVDYFSGCGVRITSYYWLRTNQSDVMSFRNEYFNEFAKVPTTDTYLGYDMTNFVIEEVIKNGNYFQSNSQNVYYDGLVAKFHLEPLPGLESIPDFYENNNLHFIEFNGLGFRSVDN